MTHLSLLFLALLLSGCETNESIHGAYMFKYGTSEIRNSDALSNYSLPTLICFGEDSVSFVSFEMDKTISNSESETNFYSQSDSNITIFHSDQQEILKIIFNVRDSIILAKQDLPKYKRVLIPLQRYEQKSKEGEIRKAFQGSGFTWSSTDGVIEFDSSGYFSWSGQPSSNFYNKKWAFASYDNELFLTLFDYTTRLIHIKAYKDGVLTCVFYSKSDQVFSLTPIEIEPTFNPSELTGKWVELLDENMPLPPVADLDNYQLEETLTIGEKSLIHKKYSSQDTVSWFANQFNNKIIINPRVKRIGNQWNVLRLKNDELTIERYNELGLSTGKYSETIIFNRMK